MVGQESGWVDLGRGQMISVLITKGRRHREISFMCTLQALTPPSEAIRQSGCQNQALDKDGLREKKPQQMRQ